MEPRVQYAKTEDGVNIAYTTVGTGSPLVVLPAVWEQFSLAWQVPHWKEALEALGHGSRLVLYDRPGFGLSQRDVSDFSLKANVRALEAVVESLALEQVALFAATLAGPEAIMYAAQSPERVTHLILYGTFSKRADVMPEEQLAAFRNMARADWSAAAQLFGDMTTREVSPEEGLAYGESFRQSADGENVAEQLSIQVDVDDLLPQLKCKTLVIHRREDALMPFSIGQKLAARIPGAQLAPLEGRVHAWTASDTKSVVDEVTSFIGRPTDGYRSQPRASDVAKAAVHTILFTDMASSTAIAQRLGDAGAQEIRRTHDQIVRDALRSHGGNEIKHTGDGIMASFATASSALDCAISIQQGVANHKESHPDSPLGVYIGLNAGEPIAEEDPAGRVDLFGTSINLAARICAHAEAGQILAANVVRELSAGKQFLFADLGETELRGFEDPVKLWDVRWREEAPGA